MIEIRRRVPLPLSQLLLIILLKKVGFLIISNVYCHTLSLLAWCETVHNKLEKHKTEFTDFAVIVEAMINIERLLF